MKFLNKLLLIALVWGMSMTSCEMTELDLLQNPNAVSPENASVDDLYNNIQLHFEDYLATMWFNTAGVSRMISHTGSFNYANATSPNDYNFLWNRAYAGMFPDIDALTTLADERGLAYHSGTSKIIKGYVLMTLVDLFGDVPLSEAGKGTDIISPRADSGQDVYAAASALFDEGIADLSGADLVKPNNDLFYSGDAEAWIKAANSLKLRMALNTDDVATINALVSGGNIITDGGDDFQFNYGSQRNNPNSRHPLYNNMYEANDGHYMSTYYMWLLRAEKVAGEDSTIVDPRIRYYFYRKVFSSDDLAENVYSCHFSNTPDQEAKPAHYDAIDPNIPYCIPSGDGYFGRDHLNAEGIPPDGPIRTAYGIYPAGGKYDDNSYQDTQNLGEDGAKGQGIQPILLSSFVDLMRAEAAVRLGTADDARALLESGVRASIAKVTSFNSSAINASQVIGTDPVTGEDIPLSVLFPSDEAIDGYVGYVLDEFDAADADKDAQLDVIGKELYIALWGNGIEAYNLFRRTCKPANMAPALEPGAGAFINSFFLPSDHVNRNANATQKELTANVFWAGGCGTY